MALFGARVAMCFKRQWHYHLFITSKEARFPWVGETGLFLFQGLWIGGDNNRWQLF